MSTTGFCIFGLDGTISDPAFGIGRSINFALQHFGYPAIRESDVSKFVGPPLDLTFTSIVGSSSSEHIGALVAKFRERYADLGYAENVLYPGIPEALRALAAVDTPLGLCTSKPTHFAD